MPLRADLNSVSMPSVLDCRAEKRSNWRMFKKFHRLPSFDLAINSIQKRFDSTLMVRRHCAETVRRSNSSQTRLNGLKLKKFFNGLQIDSVLNPTNAIRPATNKRLPFKPSK
jgi:hypothetical protein